MTHREAWAARLWACNACGVLRAVRAGFSTAGRCSCGSESFDDLGWCALDAIPDPRSGQRVEVATDINRVIQQELGKR